jgi:hypothetical protein
MLTTASLEKLYRAKVQTLRDGTSGAIAFVPG